MQPLAFFVMLQKKIGSTPLVIKGLLRHEIYMKQILFVACRHLHCEDTLRYTNEINIKQLVCTKMGQEYSHDRQGKLT